MNKSFTCGALSMLALVSCQPSGDKAADFEPKENILVVVDVQRDFFDPSGSLYVGGSEVLPGKIAEIAANYAAVIFTLDWHPAGHCSFAEQGGMWPSHCVAFTLGAGLPDCFAPVMKSVDSRTFLKGTDADREQYGAFEDLSAYPEIEFWFNNCSSVDVCGIAGDYCVKESVANILRTVPAEKVSILTDCVRSIDGGAALDAFIRENGLGRK